MVFRPQTYIPQQQAGHPDFLQSGFSHQFPQTHDPISEPPHMLHPDVQTLKRQLDTALRKIQEHEDTIVHLATLNRHTLNSLRTQDGIICTDCNQEVLHTYSSPPRSLIKSSNRYEHQPSSTLANLSGWQTHSAIPTAPGNVSGESPTASASFESSSFQVQPPLPSNPAIPTSVILERPAGMQTQLADLTASSNLFGEQLAAHSGFNPFDSSLSHFRLPPPNRSNLSVFTSDPYPDPCLSLSYLGGATSSYLPSCPPGPSNALRFHDESSNSNDSWLGKRDLHHTDLESEPERKRLRSNLLEKRSTLTPPSLPLSSFNDSFPPFGSMSSAPEVIMSPSAPGSPATEDSRAIREPESGEDWSITYNTEVKREVDVSVVRPLHVEPSISCVKFSKDGKYLAVGFLDNGATNIYDVQTGEKTCTLKEFIYAGDGKHCSIDGICFSPDGLYLATGSDCLVHIWEISKKHVRNVLASSSKEFIQCLDFSPDGRLIASGTLQDGILKIWNWRDGSLRVSEVLEHISGICFSPDGQYTVAAEEQGDVLIYNVRTGQLVEKLVGYCDLLQSIAFMPDGTGLVTGGWDKSAKCYNLSLLGFRSQDGRLEATKSSTATFRHDSELAVTLVTASPNSRWVLSCSNDGVVCISSAHSHELHCELRLHDGLEECLFDFSPLTGCLAASCLDGSQVFLWRFKEILD